MYEEACVVYKKLRNYFKSAVFVFSFENTLYEEIVRLFKSFFLIN